MWIQKLLPDLKDKQASNCETGRGKSPAQLLLHTAHTHTHNDERLCMDVHWQWQCEPHWYVWLLFSVFVLFFHTHTHAERKTNRNIFPFFAKNAQCQLAALNPVHWVHRDVFIYVQWPSLRVYFIVPQVLLNGTKWYQLRVSSWNIFKELLKAILTKFEENTKAERNHTFDLVAPCAT